MSFSLQSVGFSDPIIRIANGGPMRSVVSELVEVRFNTSKLKPWQEDFVKGLPRGVAIIGGFARGIYIGSMGNTEDIDLAIPDNENPRTISETLTYFLEDRGFVAIDKKTYKPFLELCTVFGYYEGQDTKTFARREPPNSSNIHIWNAKPIKRDFFGEFRMTIDVLVAPKEHSLEDFLNSFDISICQFAYLNGHLYATRIALEDLSKNQFRFLRRTNKERAEKYLKKGYKKITEIY